MYDSHKAHTFCVFCIMQELHIQQLVAVTEATDGCL